MPCRCDYDEYDYNRKVQITSNSASNSEHKINEKLKRELASLGKTYNDLKKECDTVTQLLCYACGYLVESDIMPTLDERLIKWWKDHNAWDKRRTLKMFKDQFGSNPDQLPNKEVVYNWFVKQAVYVHPLSDYHMDIFFHEVWEEFVSWFDGRKNRANRIAELEAELAKLKAEDIS